ncbi:hypothetical protein RhiirA1_116066 [Rhizophagus irregularis]|uniref:Uncharacterized protein n=1 Tax=Rhizophagus irregularis TaxID=588596 RepID=A0A2N0S2Z7_9GLOM|nr:hypothetical protein RhiirA1_116066 [Rhizophagus irregularis]PKK77815.1 hypothetical protein RhiirC2_37095 [Rhizophagus irregularis]
MSYNLLDLIVDGDNVYCRQHRLETCKDCDYDFKPLNTLHKSLIPIKAIKLYSSAIEMAFQRPFWEPHESTEQEVSVCLSNRSLSYIFLEQWVNAYVDAEWGIRIKPDYSKAYFRKGKALMGMKRYEEAVHAFEIGLEFEPKNESFINALEEARKLAGITDLE